jgi:hypothetical protein
LRTLPTHAARRTVEAARIIPQCSGHEKKGIPATPRGVIIIIVLQNKLVYGFGKNIMPDMAFSDMNERNSKTCHNITEIKGTNANNAPIVRHVRMITT